MSFFNLNDRVIEFFIVFSIRFKIYGIGVMIIVFYYQVKISIGFFVV